MQAVYCVTTLNTAGSASTLRYDQPNVYLMHDATERESYRR